MSATDPTFKYPYANDERESEDCLDSRVLRGGSWTNDSGLVRCAYRPWNLPDYFNNDIGFRMMVSLGYSAYGS
jgi:formylglycine-generating enzyme required for sulfatase activity